MTEEKIFYNTKLVLLNFLVAIGFWGLMIYLIIEAPRPAGIVFVVCLIAIGGQPQYVFIKNFIRLIANKPAIELTQTQYIDHQNGIRINWMDIVSVGTFTFGFWEFIAFDLRDSNIFFRQIRNPFYCLLVRFESILTKSSFKTNLSFARGDNSELFWKIYYTHKDRTNKIGTE